MQDPGGISYSLFDTGIFWASKCPNAEATCAFWVNNLIPSRDYLMEMEIYLYNDKLPFKYTHNLRTGKNSSGFRGGGGGADVFPSGI